MKRAILIAVVAGFFGSVAGHYATLAIEAWADSRKPANDPQTLLIRT